MGDLEWEERDEETPILRHMIAGSCAGAMEHVLMYPVDTIKTHMQAASSGQKLTFSEIAMTLFKQEGWWRFWNGAQWVVMGTMPAHAAFFSIYELSKRALGVTVDDFHPAAAAVVGITATLAHDSIMTPADTLKQRLQLSGFKNGVHCINQIASTEGVLSFWRSFPVTLVMNIPYNAILISVYESLKVVYLPWAGEHVSSYFVCAGISGAVAAFLTTPMDNVKTRLQTQMISSSCVQCKEEAVVQCDNPPKINVVATKDIKYTSIRSCAQQILMEDGAKGFMRGAVPRVLFFMPGAAISWSTYEGLKTVLGKYVI